MVLTKKFVDFLSTPAADPVRLIIPAGKACYVCLVRGNWRPSFKLAEVDCISENYRHAYILGENSTTLENVTFLPGDIVTYVPWKFHPKMAAGWYAWNPNSNNPSRFDWVGPLPNHFQAQAVAVALQSK